jgi:hypothetical protein
MRARGRQLFIHSIVLLEDARSDVGECSADLRNCSDAERIVTNDLTQQFVAAAGVRHERL